MVNTILQSNLDRRIFYLIISERGVFKLDKILWLFRARSYTEKIPKAFIGPRKSVITPWSTNAQEILNNLNYKEITRIEKLISIEGLQNFSFDIMTQEIYKSLDFLIVVLKTRNQLDI